jgi:hypothetical protein
MSWLFQNTSLVQSIDTPQDDITNTRTLLSTIFILHYLHPPAEHEKKSIWACEKINDAKIKQNVGFNTF